MFCWELLSFFWEKVPPNAVWDVELGTSAAILLQQDKLAQSDAKTEEIWGKEELGVCIQSTLKSTELLDFQ